MKSVASSAATAASSWIADARDLDDLVGAQAEVTLLVLPVRRDALARDAVHLLGADLDLDAAVLRADDRGVQQAVPVTTGPRDVILDAVGHRRNDAWTRPSTR
ncbi:MAG: hypothetical protein R3F59_15725 [Myxococcota bacterium]